MGAGRRGAASMRPPEFTGGNGCRSRASTSSSTTGFNEAAGIHRRKPSFVAVDATREFFASMRPPEFTGGNAPSPIFSPSPLNSLQ